MDVGNEPLPDRFWETLENYRAELIEQALSIVNNPADAEDVVQETFCEAVRDPQKLSEVRSVGAWLKTINRANALNRLRDKRHDSKRIVLKQTRAPSPASTTGGFSALEIADMMSKAVAALPDDQRKAISLHYYEHKSNDEIAKLMKISTRTVRRLLYDASMAMHSVLKVQLETPPSASAGNEASGETQ